MIDLFDSIEETTQEEVAKEEAIQENKQEAVKQEETIQDNMQEDKQESQEEATADASEDPIQESQPKQEADATADASEEAKQEEVSQAEREKRQHKNSIAIEESQEEPIQENKQEDKEIESSFKDYLKSIIPIQDFTTQEDNDSISFTFTIKKTDLIAFKQPKVYTSYEHSQKIKQGQEEAKKRGKKPGLKPGMKRERSDKKALIDQIKKLSSSFGGSMNNHELSKVLNCSLNRICNYKRQIKQELKNSN